jgi:hypothetical protein
VVDAGLATRILQSLQVWAPWIWTGSSLGVVVLCYRLGKRVRVARLALTNELHDPGRSPALLLYRERLAIAAGAFMVLMATIGVASKVFPQSVWVAIGVMLILLAVPTFIGWIVYKNFHFS